MKKRLDYENEVDDEDEPETRNLLMIDTHCHLCHPDYRKDLPIVLERSLAVGIKGLINVGYDLLTCRESVRQSEQNELLWATVGIHPHDAETWTEELQQELLLLAKQPRVVALGETGLDFYRNLSPRSTQEIVFRKQIQLARKVKLPLIIHDREAHEEVLTILDEESASDVPVIMHCFSGDVALAKRCLDRGYVLGVTGSVTFPKAEQLREVVKAVNLESLLLETDCPWLAPHPHRGKRNEPSYLPLIAETIAQLKGIDPSEVMEVTTLNARKIFSASVISNVRRRLAPAYSEKSL